MILNTIVSGTGKKFDISKAQNESKSHKKIKERAYRELKKKGFEQKEIKEEFSVWTKEGKLFRVDIVGIKKEISIAYECCTVSNPTKLSKLKEIFDIVIWLPYLGKPRKLNPISVIADAPSKSDKIPFQEFLHKRQLEKEKKRFGQEVLRKRLERGKNRFNIELIRQAFIACHNYYLKDSYNPDWEDTPTEECYIINNWYEILEEKEKSYSTLGKKLENGGCRWS